MDYDDKTEVALWRFGVLGPLVSAELEHGDLAEELRRAAERRWQAPDGRRVKLSERTIERWLYAWRRGGFGG